MTTTRSENKPRTRKAPEIPREEIHYDSIQVSKMLSVSLRTLDSWAYNKKGPKFRKIGKGRRYPVLDLDQWIAEQPLNGGEQ